MLLEGLGGVLALGSILQGGKRVADPPGFCLRNRPWRHATAGPFIWYDHLQQVHREWPEPSNAEAAGVHWSGHQIRSERILLTRHFFRGQKAQV